MSNAARTAKVARVRLKPCRAIPIRSATKVAALKKVRLPDNHFICEVPWLSAPVPVSRKTPERVREKFWQRLSR